VGLTKPPIQWAPGVLSSGVTRPGHEAGHSSPASAEVKKVDLYIDSPIRLHVVELNELSTGTLPLLMAHLVEHVPIGEDRKLGLPDPSCFSANN
jgi:hypothetical protein